MIVKVRAYKYHELDEHRQWKVAVWLDDWPLDYEDEDGEIHWEYFTDMTKEDIAEHCEANEYLFDKFGAPIHHLIEK